MKPTQISESNIHVNDNQHLLEKLSRYGMGRMSLRLIGSYLQNRQQKVITISDGIVQECILLSKTIIKEKRRYLRTVVGNIEFVESTKLLGIKIDYLLRWNLQVENLMGKISSVNLEGLVRYEICFWTRPTESSNCKKSAANNAWYE